MRIKDGLFAAVVTGLIVYSLDLLSGKEERGQAAAHDLTQISDRLNNISLQYTPPFINTTFPPDQSADDPFSPALSARQINILWFTSLTLALFSAIFGILVKQWIHEYLGWRSSTSSPRQNILVRQLRREQWHAWWVPFIIASIPALLEIAIILFLVGASVLLWKLDPHYTFPPVISVGGSLLLVFLFFTLAPALRGRSAYKSPTAEAFTLLLKRVSGLFYCNHFFFHDTWRAFLHMFRHIWSFLSALGSKKDKHLSGKGSFVSHFRKLHSDVVLISHTMDNWTSRDGMQAMKIDQLLRPGSTHISASDAFFDDFLQTTKPELDDSLNQRTEPQSDISALRSSVAPVYLDALGETDALFRALVEAARDLSDVSEWQQHLAKCAETIQPQLSCLAHPSSISSDDVLAEIAVHGGFQAITTWYMLSRVNVVGPAYMGPFYRHPVLHLGKYTSVGDYIISIIENRESLDPKVLQKYTWTPLGDSDGDSDPTHTEGSHRPGCNIISTIYAWFTSTSNQKEHSVSSSQFPVASSVIAYVLVAGFRELAQVHAVRLTSNIGHSRDNSLSSIILTRMKYMLQALQWIVFYQDDATPQFRECRKRCLTVLVDVFNFIRKPEHKVAYAQLFPEIAYQIFLIVNSNVFYTNELKQVKIGDPTIISLSFVDLEFCESAQDCSSITCAHIVILY